VSGNTLDLERLQAEYRANPESRVFATLADAFRSAGHLTEAVELLERATPTHPDYVSAFVLLGQLQEEAGRHADADATFARVLEAEPENLVALKHRAKQVYETGAVEQAAAILERILDLDPYDGEAHAARENLRRQQETRFQQLGAASAPSGEWTDAIDRIAEVPEESSDASTFEVHGTTDEVEPLVPPLELGRIKPRPREQVDSTEEHPFAGEVPEEEFVDLEPPSGVDAAPDQPPHDHDLHVLGEPEATPTEADAPGAGALPQVPDEAGHGARPSFRKLRRIDARARMSSPR
jgi:tetratricopeptide (TPR) repeat protein